MGDPVTLVESATAPVVMAVTAGVVGEVQGEEVSFRKLLAEELRRTKQCGGHCSELTNFRFPTRISTRV